MQGKEAPKQAKESEIQSFPMVKSPPKNPSYTPIIYIWFTWSRPHACCFSLCELICTLLSWFSRPYSPGVFYPIWFLKPFISSPSLAWFPEIWEEGLDGDIQFRLCVSIMSGSESFYLFSSVPWGNLSDDD